MEALHPARALAVISGNPRFLDLVLNLTPKEHAKQREGRVDLCVMFSLCLPDPPHDTQPSNS
ncbi:hypothetical protein SB11R_10070 [Pseudomonas oryzihabitans]|nr:hypothetical protein SB11R_10070 [Pseudomonas psychrotolerans]